MNDTKIYSQIISEINENNLEEKIIKIFTFEGFIYHRLNWILRVSKESYTRLNIFFILLIGSIMRKGEMNTKNFIREKNLIFHEEKNPLRKYLRLYKGSFLDEKSLKYHIDQLSKKSKTIIFKNFENF